MLHSKTPVKCSFVHCFIQLPNGLNVTPQLFQERRLHLEEQLKHMLTLFRKLRVIYDKVNEMAAQIEEPSEEVTDRGCRFRVKTFASHMIGYWIDSHSRFWRGLRGSSVVRTFTHGAMDRRINPSWGGPIELFLVPASAPRRVTKAVLCTILSVGWCI